MTVVFETRLDAVRPGLYAENDGKSVRVKQGSPSDSSSADDRELAFHTGEPTERAAFLSGFIAGMAAGSAPTSGDAPPAARCDCGRPLSPGKCGVCDRDE